MTISILGLCEGIREGELLRLEKDFRFGKVDVVIPNTGKTAGVVSSLPFKDSITASRVLSEFEDFTYVIAGKREGIFTDAEVIIPIEFSFKACKTQGAEAANMPTELIA